VFGGMLGYGIVAEGGLGKLRLRKPMIQIDDLRIDVICHRPALDPAPRRFNPCDITILNTKSCRRLRSDIRKIGADRVGDGS
jgi:hypothetical protein